MPTELEGEALAALGISQNSGMLGADLLGEWGLQSWSN